MDLLTRGLDSPIIPRCTVVNVCVPTLKRYDLLANLLRSLNAGYLRPTAVYIINNGLDKDALFTAVKETIDCPVKILTPKKNLGVSASWNWFIRNVAEDRVIVNGLMRARPGAKVKPEEQGATEAQSAPGAQKTSN